MTFNYRGDYLNIVCYSQCHQFQWLRLLNSVAKITFVSNSRFYHLKRLEKILRSSAKLFVRDFKVWAKQFSYCYTPSFTVKCQNNRVSRNQRPNQQKVGSAHVCLSNNISAGRRSGQGSVVKFHLASVLCLVSERPVFKTWVVGLNLCQPRSRPLPRMPGSRLRTNLQRQVSSNSHRFQRVSAGSN